MLQLLFEQTPPKEKQPRLVEVNQKRKQFKQDSFASSLEAIELRKEKNIYKKELQDTKNEFEAILDKVNIVKSSFGKNPKLQLDISIEELNSLKEKIKN
jgi:archaellum component FlaC